MEARIWSPAGREHAVARSLLNVALAGVLREVPDLPGTRHRSAVGLSLPRQDAHRRGFTRAVAPDQADPVACLHTQVLARGVQQGTRADADFKVVGDNHKGSLYPRGQIT